MLSSSLLVVGVGVDVVLLCAVCCPCYVLRVVCCVMYGLCCVFCVV